MCKEKGISITWFFAAAAAAVTLEPNRWMGSINIQHKV